MGYREHLGLRMIWGCTKVFRTKKGINIAAAVGPLGVFVKSLLREKADK